VPLAFSKAIAQAISKDRDNRQSTAGELAAQLRVGLKDAPAAQSSVGQTSDRTFPDIPRPEGSYHTQGSPGGITSKSDVNAATIVTVDAASTSPPNIAPPIKPSPAQPAAQESREAAADDGQSVVTVVRPTQPHEEPQPHVEPKESRGKPLVFAGAGVLILVVVVLGIAGLFALYWFKFKPNDNRSARNNTEVKANNGSRGTSAPNATEFGRYWLEVLPNALVAEPERVVGAVPLASGQSFKFHFVIGQKGYLYIIGPGDENRPTAFLTAQPAAISGLESNEVLKGSDFSFPEGIERWMELDKKAGTEDYTIIFSPEQLSEPAFLNSQVTRKPLTDAEQGQLKAFLSKYQTTQPVTQVNDSDAAAPFVSVKVPPSENSGAPVIFQIRIEHK
jgi:hypothetical protein